MKPEKPARARHKLSFAVDREDIDTSTTWVDAVVVRPPASQTPLPVRPAPESGSFFGRKPETATVEPAATDTRIATEAQKATGANNATEAENATGALFEEPYSATVVTGSTVERNSTVAGFPASDASGPWYANPATVALRATVAKQTTVALFQPSARTFRLRPIRRVTDGLTPGQFAVYRLMFEQGDAQPGLERRLYRGGYVDLCRLTGLSKRGIQNAVAELIRKSVLSIHQAPGYHRTQTTVYEVPAEESVLQTWYASGFRYAVGKSKTLVNIATVEQNPTV